MILLVVRTECVRITAVFLNAYAQMVMLERIYVQVPGYKPFNFESQMS